MKLPLKYGLPLLGGLLLVSGYGLEGAAKSLGLTLAMVVALWTAFSLPIVPNSQREAGPDEPGEDEPPWVEDEAPEPQQGETDGKGKRKKRKPLE